MAGIIDVSGVGGWLLNIALILAIILIGGAVSFGVFKLIEYQRKYNQFIVAIWEKDGFGQFRQTFDKGGIFVDKKTNDKRLYLKKNKVGLDCNTVPYVPTSNGKKIIYLLKTGSKNFKYIKPNVHDEIFTFTVGEEDVNWGLQAYAKQKVVFGQNTLLQYLPYIALVIVAIIIMVIFIYFFKNFEVLRDVAVAFEKAAASIAQYNGATYNSTLVIG